MSQTRPPIIAVVGHIDHGKSTLQHALRESDSMFSEAGGITQHIGAYELHARYDGKERKATIIDTPGHEAFSMIREHGLDLADMALLVVSSEEGWKNQTGEAYSMIQKNQLPYIVVFTKTDTSQSNIEHAKQTVMQEGVLLEQFGGSVPWVAVSSITNEGIGDLIDLIFLTTDVYEIVEDRKDGSVGVLVEASVDSKTGVTGTIIVLQGILEQNNYIRVGNAVAPLRIMRDDRGNSVSVAKPSTPVQVAGFSAVPTVGESVFLHTTKKEAMDAIEEDHSDNDQHAESHDLSNIFIPLVLRSDTASGLSSVRNAIADVAADGVSFTIIKQDVGDVTEEDVRLAVAQDDGHVLGFHTGADQRAKQYSERNGVTIRLFPTIYEVTQWATALSKQKQEEYALQHSTGSATIIRIFEDQSSQKMHLVGAQIQRGSFSVQQDVVVLQNGSPAGRFSVDSIEQRNTACDTVSGEDVQFAMRIHGDGAIALDDTVVALPHITPRS